MHLDFIIQTAWNYHKSNFTIPKTITEPAASRWWLHTWYSTSTKLKISLEQYQTQIENLNLLAQVSTDLNRCTTNLRTGKLESVQSSEPWHFARVTDPNCDYHHLQNSNALVLGIEPQHYHLIASEHSKHKELFSTPGIQRKATPSLLPRVLLKEKQTW